MNQKYKNLIEEQGLDEIVAQLMERVDKIESILIKDTKIHESNLKIVEELQKQLIIIHRRNGVDV